MTAKKSKNTKAAKGSKKAAAKSSRDAAKEAEENVKDQEEEKEEEKKAEEQPESDGQEEKQKDRQEEPEADTEGKVAEKTDASGEEEKADAADEAGSTEKHSFGRRNTGGKSTGKKTAETKPAAKGWKQKLKGLFSFGRKKAAEDQEEETDAGPEDGGAARRPFVIEVREKKEKSSVAAFFESINYLGMGKYRHMFIQTMGTMLNAGLPLLDSLKAFEAEVRSKAVKKLVRRITVAVENGTPLWRAMSNTNFFTPYEIALVHIGEDAGNLARNMEYLSEQQEKDHALRQKVKMAMIYPTIVMTMMFVIVMGLGIFVLPNLVQVLYSLNVELPLTTRIVIRITKFFEAYGLRLAPSLAALFILLALLSKYTRFRAVTQWFMFRIPGIGSLAKEATIARFGVIMGGLLRAGVPVVEAMESLVDVTQVYSYRVFYAKVLKRITVGDSFAKAFEMMPESKKLLPVSVQQLVVTGERSGTLSETLLKVSDIYESKAEETAEKLPIILEPVLLLFIGALVATIAFAIIVPIYSVVGNVGSG